MEDEQLLIEEKHIREVYIMKHAISGIYKVMVWTLLISMMLASMAGIGESERLTYDQIKDVIFNTMVDGERVFKYPSENSYFSSSGRQLRCNGAILITVPGIKDGELQIGSLFLIFNTENDNQETKYDVESAQQENVFELIGDSLLEYIDFENGGKITFCMTQSLEDESQILYEYSPLISQFSDKDLFKTQNYDEFDSFDAFKEKVYGVLYSANHGGDPAPEDKGESVEDAKQDNTLQKGSKGDAVVKLQNRLNELGYSVGKADGDFGNKTKMAIEQFQSNNGLEVTGIADEKTQEILYSEDAKGNAEKAADDITSSGIDPEIINAGIDYASEMALEQTAKLWDMPKSSLWVGEVYCEDKGNNVYQFGAKVYRNGDDKGGMGFGEGIAFSKDSKGHWVGKADNVITVYSMGGKIPGELVWSKEPVKDAGTTNQSSVTDEASLIAAGMKYISSSVMEFAPSILGVSEDQCRITEIYYLDKGDNTYQLTARVSRGGPGGYGIGKELTITPKAGGNWDIVDNNHITMYGGSDTIPGELVFGDADEASIAKGMQILGEELKKLDINSDGELSIDEIFKMN